MGEISIKTIEVSGFNGALEGMRAPMKSYDRKDTKRYGDILYLGDNDLTLATNLIKAGTEHSKFRRMIHVQAKISMPRYIFQELDQYRIATAMNSESTMHKLLNNKNPIDLSSFYLGSEDSELYEKAKQIIISVIEELEDLRLKYLGVKSTDLTKEELLILAKRILPESFIQTSYWDANYETIANIYKQRVYHPHRLKEEWVDTFGEWVESLPYSKELILSGLE